VKKSLSWLLSYFLYWSALQVNRNHFLLKTILCLKHHFFSSWSAISWLCPQKWEHIANNKAFGRLRTIKTFEVLDLFFLLLVPNTSFYVMLVWSSFEVRHHFMSTQFPTERYQISSTISRISSSFLTLRSLSLSLSLSLSCSQLSYSKKQKQMNGTFTFTLKNWCSRRILVTVVRDRFHVLVDGIILRYFFGKN